MKFLIILSACLAFTAAIDDGQWKPALDGSYKGIWNPYADGTFYHNMPNYWNNPMYVHRFKRDLITPYGRMYDDGQWKPALDGSWLGSGNLHWGKAITPLIAHRFKRDLITPYGRMYDDGQWKPAYDGSWLGSGKLVWGKGMIGAPALLGHRFKRDLLAKPYGMYPYFYNAHTIAPLDTPQVAIAKHAQLIQQATEGARNMIGGIPLALPADTPEVAQGKIAHAIAHNYEKNMKAGIYTPFVM